MKWLGPSLVKNIILSNFMRLPQPYKITFSVTSRCNSKCKICGIWKKGHGDELKKEEIDRVFGNIKAKWINITGGEVFLRDDIFEIAKSAKRNSNPSLFNITTNGLMTDRIIENVKKIEKLNFPKLLVVVSIDGPEKIHDKIRGTKGSWKRAIETYKGLKEICLESSLEVFMGYTICEYNLGFLKETYREVKDAIPSVSKKDFHFNLFHVSPHYYFNEECGNGLLDKKNELLEEIKIANGAKIAEFSPVTFVEKMYLSILRKYVRNGKVPLRCASLSSSCFIDPVGNVYPCIHFNKKIGNLRENDYDLVKIWNSERAMAIREEIKKGRCPKCWTPCESYQTILANLMRFKL